MNPAILWFCGFRPGESLPDHSSLTRFRQRLGADGFESIFRRVVDCCVRSGLVRGDFAHAGACGREPVATASCAGAGG
jgi:IS5 family transposase